MKSINTKNILHMLLREAGIGVALVAVSIIFCIFATNFATPNNFTNILTQISINTVISVGMTFVILLGGIDLSVGSVLALATVVAGLTIANKEIPASASIPLAVLLSIVVSGVCGLFNGFVSEKWKIHSFIVTLGMLNVARGAALQVSNSRTIFSFPAVFNHFGTVMIFGVPIIFIMAIILVAIGTFVLNKTVFGRLIYAIGNNEEAVRLSGHNTSIIKVAAFTFCGVCVGIAAIMYMLRLNISSPILGNGFELNAIAAVVIGGTSMSGGKGSLIGTFLGACIMGVLNNGLLLIGLGDFARQMITGLIIVAAVVLDTYRAKLSVALTKNSAPDVFSPEGTRKTTQA
jgi:ribose transport system permease protein